MSRRVVVALSVLSLILGIHVWSSPHLGTPHDVAYSCVNGSEPACTPTHAAQAADTTGSVVASALSAAMTSPANGAVINLAGVKPASQPKKASDKRAAKQHASVNRIGAGHVAHSRPVPRNRPAAHRAVNAKAVKTKIARPRVGAHSVSTTSVGRASTLTHATFDDSTWPSDATTGVPTGTQLRSVGSIDADTPGQVIDSVDVSGTINVTARGVIIRNCRVHSTTAPYGVLVYSGGSVRIENCEFYGQREAAISGNSWAAFRVNIHSQQSDGVKLGSNCTLKDSFIHDFTPSAGSHADGGQMQNGVHHLTVTHNTILMGTSKADNSALMFSPDLGPSGAGPVEVSDNLLGGGGITLRIVDGNDGQYHQRGYSVTGNRFVPDAIYQEVRVGEPVAAFAGWSDNRLTRPRD